MKNHTIYTIEVQKFHNIDDSFVWTTTTRDKKLPIKFSASGDTPTEAITSLYELLRRANMPGLLVITLISE